MNWNDLTTANWTPSPTPCESTDEDGCCQLLAGAELNRQCCWSLHTEHMTKSNKAVIESRLCPQCCSIITFRLNFSATAKVISVPPVLSWCYYSTFYYAIVDYEMASCYSSHSKKFLIDWCILMNSNKHCSCLTSNWYRHLANFF